ncbi:hypothetical protein PLICRDRAFT_176696 [Plicaturopsis crispa FD-325 SS-3]|nr:hypothetical protein PLICRDRAFT_176696 [Plicaturopsis crispa FD-325 SS-3]
MWFAPLQTTLAYGLLVKGARAALRTIDDTSSLITYQGDWYRSASTLDYGGSHAWSEDRNATATLAFSGTEIAYLAPQWPHVVNVQLSLDDRPAEIIDLQDHDASHSDAGSESSVVWRAHSLSDGHHTLVVSMADHSRYVIVDAIAYDDGTAASRGGEVIHVMQTQMASVYSRRAAVLASPTPNHDDAISPGESTDFDDSANSDGERAVAAWEIAVGVTVGAFLLSGLVGCAAFCYWRRRQRRYRALDRSHAEAFREDSATGLELLPDPAMGSSVFGASQSGHGSYQHLVPGDIAGTHGPYDPYAASSLAAQNVPAVQYPPDTASMQFPSDGSRNPPIHLYPPPTATISHSTATHPPFDASPNPPRDVYPTPTTDAPRISGPLPRPPTNNVTDPERPSSSSRLSRRDEHSFSAPNHLEDDPVSTAGRAGSPPHLPADVSVREAQAWKLARFDRPAPAPAGRAPSPPPAYN